MLKALVTLLCLLPMASAAQEVVEDCSDWRSSARNIPEPWEQFTRTFANGAVRVTLFDTVEPAAGAFYLQVISPPYDELGSATCVLVTEAGGQGFGGLDFAALRAAYDPGVGLVFRLPVSRYRPDDGSFRPGTLGVSVNQSTGAIGAWVEAP